MPRKPTGLLIVAGLMALPVLWGKVLVPRLTSRPALGGALTAAPVLLLVGAVLLPALVDRQVDEGLLEGIPVAQAQEVLAASAPPGASPKAAVGTSEAPASVETPDSSVVAATPAPASPAAPAPASPAAAHGDHAGQRRDKDLGGHGGAPDATVGPHQLVRLDQGGQH